MMHQEIECPESEWGLDYIRAQFTRRMKVALEEANQSFEKYFWQEPASYAMARQADADLSPGDACDALDRNAFGIEFYVSREPSK